MIFSAIGANWLRDGCILRYGRQGYHWENSRYVVSVMIFVLIGFNHVIANFSCCQLLILMVRFLLQMLHNLVPAFLGNTFVAYYSLLHFISQRTKIMLERYSREQLRDIWSLKNQYQTWLDVEIAVDAGWVAEVHFNRGSCKIRANAKFDVIE